jgi:hypothetical protein
LMSLGSMPSNSSNSGHRKEEGRSQTRVERKGFILALCSRPPRDD